MPDTGGQGMHRPLGRAPSGKGVIMRKTIQKVFPVMEHMNIPNTITIAGPILGMLNIFFIVQEHYHLYYICALLAGIMDTLDGFAAKRLNQYSELGEQLDSLCDGINFVLVPAVFAVTRMDMRLGTMICAGICSRMRHLTPWLLQYLAGGEDGGKGVCWRADDHCRGVCAGPGLGLYGAVPASAAGCADDPAGVWPFDDQPPALSGLQFGAHILCSGGRGRTGRAALIIGK